MSSVWDRRNRRISYQVPVGVVDLQEQRVLNMSSINVSRGGIFVDTDAQLPIGAPVMCNLPFGRDESAMQLRGRVAWHRAKSSSTPNRPGGVGIEFVDLSDEESDKLSDLVGSSEELSHQLSVKLPGLAKPVHGEAFLTPRGVFFRSKLPFLALDSNVDFVFDEEDEDLVYDGKIVCVDVFNDPGSPVPRLQVEIAVNAEDMPDALGNPKGDEEGEGFGMMHVDTADTLKNFTGAEAIEVVTGPEAIEVVTGSEALEATTGAEALEVVTGAEALEVVTGAEALEVVTGAEALEATTGAETTSEQIVIEIPQMIPIVVAEVEGTSVVADELTVQKTERVSLTAGLSARFWPAAALLVACFVGILAFAFTGSDEGEDAQAQLAAASADDIALTSLSPGNVEDSAAARLKSEQAEEAMDRIRAAALSDQEELGDRSGQEQSLAAANPRADGEDKQHVRTQPSDNQESEAITKPKIKAGLQERIGGVKIWENDNGDLVVRVPIEGNLQQATHYPLADPPGLAINLPYALPASGFHQSLAPQHERIRTLWVRERLGGLHLRAFFDKTAASCDVKYTASAVLVRCGF